MTTVAIFQYKVWQYNDFDVFLYTNFMIFFTFLVKLFIEVCFCNCEITVNNHMYIVTESGQAGCKCWKIEEYAGKITN